MHPFAAGLGAFHVHLITYTPLTSVHRTVVNAIKRTTNLNPPVPGS
jgi:hypothetical protein